MPKDSPVQQQPHSAHSTDLVVCSRHDKHLDTAAEMG